MKRIKVVILMLLIGSAAGGQAATAVRDQPAGNSLEQGLWWLYHLIILPSQTCCFF